jgi:exonuclease SbcC
MIKFIELTRWKTHEHTRIEFSKGTNLIVGRMGAGKSSIMDAISYALFGTFPALQKGRLATKDIIRKGAGNGASAIVKLGFSAGDDEYIVTREISGLRSSAKLERNGKYMQSQPVKVTEEIESIMKVDYESFARVVYSEQNGLEYFLGLRAAERKRQLDSMLGLDRFAAARDNAGTLAGRIDGEARSLESAFKGLDIQGMENEIASYKSRRMQESGSLEEKRALEKELLERLAGVSARLAGMKEQYAKRMSLEKEILRISSRKEALEKELAQISIDEDIDAISLERHISELKVREREILGKANAAEEEYRRVRENISSLQERKRRIESEMAVRRQRMDEIEKLRNEKPLEALDNLEAEVKGIEAKIAEDTVKIAEIRTWIEDLKRYDSVCPVCERELDGALRERLLEAKKATLVQIEEESRAIKKTLDGKRLDAETQKKKKGRLESLIALLESASDPATEIEVVARRIGALEKNRSETEVLIKGIKKEEESVRNEIASSEKLRESIVRRERYRKEITDAKAQALLKSGEMESIIVSEVDIMDLGARETELSAEKARLGESILAIERLISQIDSEIKVREAHTRKAREIERRLNYMKEISSNVIKFRESIEETQGSMRAQLINAINSAMGEVWPSIYPYNDYPGIRLDAENEDYVLMLNSVNGGEGEWLPVESIASGGERSIACLAMRIAFALVLVPNLKWLILDEPTHNIDAAGIDAFIGMFGTELPKIVDQIFIVTHDEKLKEAGGSSVISLERDKASGGSTNVVL